MKKMGRPIIQIQWADFEKLCALHCTLEEIASFFDCSEDTVERRVKEHYGQTFADVYTQKSAKGKISLRRQMWKVAMSKKPNITMMIWLSKQYLGFSDGDEPPDNSKHKEVVVYETEWGSPENSKGTAEAVHTPSEAAGVSQPEDQVQGGSMGKAVGEKHGGDE